MAPVKQRLLRLAVAHYHKEDKSDEDFHKWVTENHCARAAPICERHGVVSYGMHFSPEPMRDLAAKLNSDWGNRFTVSNHHVTVEYYMRTMEQVYAVAADPDFQALHGEEADWVSRLNAVASIGWVEIYLEGGRVVNVRDGKPTYPPYQVMADTLDA